MPTTAVIADSSCGLPPELVAQWGITIVPIDVIVDSVVSPNLTSQQLVDALRHGRTVTTSRPNPEDFLQVFRHAVEQGADQLLVATLSAELSGTHESAMLACREVGVPIRVVDTRNVGLGFGFAVLDAARMVREDPTSPLDVMALALERTAASTSVFVYLDSLVYLRRGGRISATSAFVGTALSVKPIVQITGGQIAPCDKVRTEYKALARLVELAGLCGPEAGPRRFGVQHLGAPDKAEHCVQLLLTRHPGADIVVSEVTPVIGAHAGPGLVAVIAPPLPGD